jgi:hypothetical protein
MSAGRRLVADVAYLDGVAQRLASHSLHTAVAKRTEGQAALMTRPWRWQKVQIKSAETGAV